MVLVQAQFILVHHDVFSSISRSQNAASTCHNASAVPTDDFQPELGTRGAKLLPSIPVEPPWHASPGRVWGTAMSVAEFCSAIDSTLGRRAGR